MTTIDASVLRAAWAASRPDVETYLAKCDEPARYRSWAGNAFGLRALLKAAGIRVPVDHKGDEVGGCFDWTHLHYFGFGSGAAESTLACLGYGLALFVEDCAKDAAPRDQYWPTWWNLDRAVIALGDEAEIGRRADVLFAADYKLAFPGKRAGTKHFHVKKAETRAKAIGLVRSELRRLLEAELATARREFAGRAEELARLDGRAVSCELRAGVGDLVAALATLEYAGAEAELADRLRAVVARWNDAPSRLRRTAEAARNLATVRREDWKNTEAEAVAAIEAAK